MQKNPPLYRRIESGTGFDWTPDRSLTGFDGSLTRVGADRPESDRIRPEFTGVDRTGFDRSLPESDRIRPMLDRIRPELIAMDRIRNRTDYLI